MPIHAPSQAQTGWGKFAEGLFGGIGKGVEGQREEDLKRAYRDAMMQQAVSKGDTAVRVQELKNAAALNKPPKPVAGKQPRAFPRSDWAGTYSRAVNEAWDAAVSRGAQKFQDLSSLTPDQIEAANRAFESVVRPFLHQTLAERQAWHEGSYGSPLPTKYSIDPGMPLDWAEVSTPEGQKKFLGIFNQTVPATYAPSTGLARAAAPVKAAAPVNPPATPLGGLITPQSKGRSRLDSMGY